MALKQTVLFGQPATTELTKAGSLVYMTARACNYGGTSLDAVPKHLRDILETSAWRHFETFVGEEEVFYGGDEFEKFARAEPPRGLGRSIEGLIRLCEAQTGVDVKAETRDNALAAIRLLREKMPAEAKHGGQREAKEQGNNITLLRGTSDTYLLRRLKRDVQDENLAEPIRSHRAALLAKVTGGEMSAHAAGIEAGFVKPMIQHEPTVAGFTRAIKRHLTDADRLQLAEQLKEAK